MDSTLADMEGVVAYHDDILMYAKSKSELDDIMHNVFTKLQSLGFRLKLSKCEFYKSELKYLGHLIVAGHIKPDPEKLAAIANMQAPTNVTQLRSLLGNIAYHSRFIKQMRHIRAPMDELLKKSNNFIWNTKCQAAFEQFKQLILSDLQLTTFDPNKPIILATDASQDGLGACLMHAYPDGTEKYIYCCLLYTSPSPRDGG